MPAMPDANPKYVEIARTLRAEIGASLSPGDYLPSTRQLRARFGVTLGTVRQALALLEQEGVVQTLPFRGTVVLDQAVTAPGRARPAVAPPGARTPATGTPPAVALVMPTPTYLLVSLAHGVERELRRHGMRLQLCGSLDVAAGQAGDLDAVANYEREVLETLARDGVAGVIWWSILGERNASAARALQGAGLPLVLVDEVVPGVDADWVGIDDFGAAVRATDHLLGLGHRRIAFAADQWGVIRYVTGERIAGYVDALQRAGVEAASGQPLPPHVRFRTTDDLDRYLPPGLRPLVLCSPADPVAPLLDLSPRPSAVLAANDHVAEFVLQSARIHGVRIPEDLAVVSFGNVDRYIGRHSTLTTVHQPFDLIGQRAVRLLLQRSREPDRPVQHVHLATRLVIRGSCGAPVAHDPGADPAQPFAVAPRPAATASG